MKILTLGDIHGRTCWEDIIKIENPDIVVFLGDYVSTHEGISGKSQISNLINILNYKKDNPNKVILLRGNHDMQHCGFDWAQCSGLYLDVQQWMMDNVNEFLKLTQWVYLQDNIIFSHAGISKTWYNDNGFTSIESINNCEPNYKFGFTPDSFLDYTGTSETQPLTWIRPQSLLYCAIDGFTYVVGHTPVRRICNITELFKKEANVNLSENISDIWCCDNLPNEYLIIEDGKFIVKQYK